MFMMPNSIISKGILMIATLLIVFITGMIVGLIVGLIIGNTAIGDALLELLESYQALLDERLY